MIIGGADYLQELMKFGQFDAKMVFNATAAIIFTTRTQHSDMKAFGLSYEHESAGNALAAMIKPGLIEIRFHRAFSEERVAAIIEDLVNTPELHFMKNWQVTYQGRVISEKD